MATVVELELSLVGGSLMKIKSQTALVAVGLALMGCGSARLRPPDEDKLAWEQKQNEERQPSPSELALYRLLLELWPVGWSPSP